MMTRRWGAPLIVGVLGFLFAAYGIWRPSFWYDEAATVSATERTVPQTIGLVKHTDLVHAAYYFLMHGWTAIFGFSEFAMRLPSAMAVGAAGAVMVVLGERLYDKCFGVVCGVLLVAMPRTMWAGSEARSYAGTILLAVLCTLCLLIAVERGRRRWAAYAMIGIVTAVWFFLSVTLLVAHLAIVLIMRRRPPRGFLCAAAVIVVAVAPFARYVFRQRAQVSWIPDMDLDTLRSFARFEVPDGSLVYLVAALTILVLGVVVAVTAGPVMPWRVLLIGLCWWLLPSAVVLAYSWIVTPTYTPRYLVFALPGVAIALAWSVAQLARRRAWLLMVFTGLLVAVTIPHYLGQRAPYGRFGGTDFSAVADYIGSRAQPGDCVAFDGPPSWSPVSMRVIRSAKEYDFTGLRDVGAAKPAGSSDLLWDREKPLADYGAFARSCGVVWVITDGERDRPASLLPGGTTYWRFAPHHFVASALYDELSRAGLHIVDSRGFNNSQVVQMRR